LITTPITFAEIISVETERSQLDESLQSVFTSIITGYFTIFLHCPLCGIGAVAISLFVVGNVFMLFMMPTLEIIEDVRVTVMKKIFPNKKIKRKPYYR